MSLENNKAIVTGGLQGIGLCVAEKLLENGCNVVILDVQEDKWEQLRKEWINKFPCRQFHFVMCNLLNRKETISSFEKAHQLLDGLDIVINNAGVSDELNWDICLDIDFKAMIRVAYIGVNLMSLTNGGRGGVVVNSASCAGLANFPFPAYAAAKHGITAFTRSIEKIPEFLALHGVRVNSVCLGFTKTKLVRQEYIKQGERLDDFPSISLLNNFRDQMWKQYPFEAMIPIEKAASLYLQLIQDKTVHAKNLFYAGIQQEKPLFHEYEGIERP